MRKFKNVLLFASIIIIFVCIGINFALETKTSIVKWVAGFGVFSVLCIRFLVCLFQEDRASIDSPE